jgi:hypothetical protein
MKRTSVTVLTVLAASAVVAAQSGEAVSASSATKVGSAVTARPGPGKIKVGLLSAGARSWFKAPATGATAPAAGGAATRSARIAFGSNVDAADPNEDLAAGQSETAIAAAGSTVVTAWNDVSAFLVQPSTDQRASATGLGVSTDGGRHFRDLIGLRNNRLNQQWFGDPSVIAVDPDTFLIGSLYLPATVLDCSPGHQAHLQLAVEVLSLGAGGAASLGLPVVTADGGDVCPLFNSTQPPPNIGMLDKDWLSYDKHTRTLAMSYTRFFFGFGGQSGSGQIEVVRAHLPADPRTLTAHNWSAPITVWPEELTIANQGAYVSVSSTGDAYLAWERNLQSNTFNGNPFVFIHAARVRAGDRTPTVGGPAFPRVVSLGQRNSNGAGGVKSLDAVAIAGYNRGTGQDMPRIAVDGPLGKVIVTWNDASAHPLGDIWMRALPLNLAVGGPITKVNDDNSYALHFLPALSIRGDGAVVTSWYDRRLTGPDSARTDYFGEVRATPTGNATDFRVTTGSTDWAGTSSVITPNFGDYTDNASTGGKTYFTWSDGRIGVPQPFVDSR